MTRRSRIVGSILLVALIVMACSQADGGVKKKDPPSASHAAANLLLTDRTELEGYDGRILSLSPDGQWLVVDQGPALCIYQVGSHTPQTCASIEQVGPLSVKGVVWSPDGEQLIFSRSTFRDGAKANTKLYRIQVNGGDPKEVLEVAPETPLAVWHGLAWSSDGKDIFYTVGLNRSNHPDNGIWTVGLDGTNPRHLVGVDLDLGPPLLLDVAATGEKMLLFYFQALGWRVAEPNSSFFYIWDLKTGQREPLKLARGSEIEFTGLNKATFSPDGSKILYTYLTSDDLAQLVVRDVGGGPENVLLKLEAGDGHLGFQLDVGLGLDWAEDDKIFVALSNSTGLLSVLVTE